MSGFLAREGAVAAHAPDEQVPAHYGQWVAEQRAFEAGESIVDLSNRDVFSITGPDRLTWLHSLTTQYFEGLVPDTATEALILSPQGKIEHGFTGFDDGETFVGHTEPGAAHPLLEFLERMKFFSRVEIGLASEYAVLGEMNGQDLRYRVVQRSELADLAAPDQPAAGLWAFEAMRIARGLVRIGLDTDDRTIPNEVGLIERAVHLDKGCYRGQETVAKIHNLGRPPRRLARLMLDGSVNHLPAVGSPIVIDDRVVGRVGTSALHHEMGPIALALVKRSLEPARELVVDGVAATTETIVDPDVGLHARPTLG